jgi:hypothetical protein
MKAICTLFIFTLTSNFVQAQAPNWSVTPSDFTYTMSLVVAANNECTEVNAANYRIAIFDKGGQCRGFSDLFNTSAGYRGFPTVYSNVINEELYYRIYDADENEVYWSYLTRLEFLAEAIQGSVSEPIRVFYDAAPAIDAGPDQVVENSTSTTLAATGTSGVWLIVYGEGGSFEDQSSPTTLFFGQAGETYQLVWTVTDGVCLNEMDHVIITFSGGCPVSLVFDNTTIESSTPTYTVSETITSQANIESGANVQYRAGQSITLRPGFHAKSGSLFHAKLEACSSNGVDEPIEQRTISSFPNYLNVFPNPTSDQFQIQFKDELTTAHQLSLFDGQGRLIRQWINDKNSDIFVADLSPGLYWLLLRSEELEEQHKIVVMK